MLTQASYKYRNEQYSLSSKDFDIEAASVPYTHREYEEKIGSTPETASISNKHRYLHYKCVYCKVVSGKYQL